MLLDVVYRFLKKLRGKNRYHYLAKYIKQNKCKNIIEIGTWNGNNSKKMLAAAVANKSENDINYWGFDLWEQMNDEIFEKEYSKHPPEIAYVKKTLEATGCNINLFQGDTKDTLKRFKDDNLGKINVDFIYIDGGHSFETIQSDWDNINGFIESNTLTIFDDYYIYLKPDKSTGVGEDLKPTFGCSKLIESLDKSVWDFELLPHYDQFGARKVYFVLVTKKV